MDLPEHFTPSEVNSTDPFSDFHPILWNPQGQNGSGEEIYSIKRNHGIFGMYKLHNPNDEINDDKPMLQKIIIEYIINNYSYPIYTVADLLDSTYPFDEQNEGNVLGDIAERISRRITKYFIKHWSKQGKTGGIFDQNFDIKNCENFIVAHNNEYVLKIQRYPNLIILKKTGKGKYGYENIKELDGFFDYRYLNKRHILVLESKLEKLNIDCDVLVTDLFTPLRQLFPEASFSYLLFTDKNSIYSSGSQIKFRRLRDFPAKIHERLSRENIGTIFFSFNECRDDFERMKNFLVLQYRAIRNQSLTLFGKTIITEKELTIFDGGETPRIKLIKDFQTGLWREVPLRHKNK
jgi:hypothetical protein